MSFLTVWGMSPSPKPQRVRGFGWLHRLATNCAAACPDGLEMSTARPRLGTLVDVHTNMKSFVPVGVDDREGFKSSSRPWYCTCPVLGRTAVAADLRGSAATDVPMGYQVCRVRTQ